MTPHESGQVEQTCDEQPCEWDEPHKNLLGWSGPLRWRPTLPPSSDGPIYYWPPGNWINHRKKTQKINQAHSHLQAIWSGVIPSRSGRLGFAWWRRRTGIKSLWFLAAGRRRGQNQIRIHWATLVCDFFSIRGMLTNPVHWGVIVITVRNIHRGIVVTQHPGNIHIPPSTGPVHHGIPLKAKKAISQKNECQNTSKDQASLSNILLVNVGKVQQENVGNRFVPLWFEWQNKRGMTWMESKGRKLEDSENYLSARHHQGSQSSLFIIHVDVHKFVQQIKNSA